jgi:hypothetical protein
MIERQQPALPGRDNAASSSLPTGLDEFESAFGAMAKAAMQAGILLRQDSR